MKFRTYDSGPIETGQTRLIIYRGSYAEYTGPCRILEQVNDEVFLCELKNPSKELRKEQKFNKIYIK